MDDTTNTTEQAKAQTHKTVSPDGPYGSVPMPDEPVVVKAPSAIDEDMVPMPAWVEEQRREQEAERKAQEELAAQPDPEEPEAQPTSAGGQSEDQPGHQLENQTEFQTEDQAEDQAEDQNETPDTPAFPKLDPLPAPPTTRQIALINQKGGVGKTTTTVNLGAALAASGLRVLLIDLDPQAHLTLSLGLDPDELDLTIYDLLAGSDVVAADVVQNVPGCERLGILPADTNLAGIESELSEQIKTGLAQTLLRNKCASVMEQFDYVLIDCPPSLGLLTINGLTCAKEIIVPMQAHFLALQGMGKLFETINMIRQGINPSLSVSGVVLCMHEANTILASDVVADVQDFFAQAKGTALPWADAVVYQPPVRRNIKLAEAPSFGQSVLTYAHDSNGAKDYAKLAKSVATASV